MTTEVSPLLVTDDSQVRFIRLNRPAELNALRRVDIEAATEAVNQIPHSARALVFAGEGERAFGTGVHLENFVSMTPERAREFISALARLFAAVRRAAVPSVAMIRGYCLGGAFELAMACDLRVAATDAWFGLPEIKLGIPSVIDAALLERHVGLGMAREMILTGDSYDVDQMERRGLVNAVAEPERLMSKTREMLGRLTRHTATVQASQKRLLEDWLNCGVDEAVRHSIDEFADVFNHSETAEQIDAYRRERVSSRRSG